MRLRVHQLHNERVSESVRKCAWLCRLGTGLLPQAALWAPAGHESPPLRRASDKCQREKRKTINGDDLLWAMGTLGFEEYVEPLNLYLHKYREVCLQLKRLAATVEARSGHFCNPDVLAG